MEILILFKLSRRAVLGIEGGVVMLTRNDLLPLKFVEKEDFAGSYKGMRFLLHKEMADEGKKLKAYVWSEPFCFDATPDDEKLSELFEFSEEGLAAAIAWMNGKYEFIKKQPDGIGCFR